MPVPPHRPEVLRLRVFRGTEAVARGDLTPAQLRSTAWRRLRRDVYCDAHLPVTHALHARGVATVMPSGAAFGGLTAAMLWGADELVDAGTDVEVVLPPGVRWTPGPGIRCRTAELAGDVVHRRGVPRTARGRTALDLVRRGPLDDAVVILDRLVHRGVVQLIDVREAVPLLTPGRGTRQALAVARLADGLAASPPETRLRLLMLRAGIRPPKAQHRIFDDRGFVSRVDFAWPE